MRSAGESATVNLEVLSVCNESVIVSLEIPSLYWNSLPFRGGPIASLHTHRKIPSLAEGT